MSSSLICVGKILKPHGIKGALKIQSFTEPPMALEEYFPLCNEKETLTFSLRSFCPFNPTKEKEMFLVSLEEVENRTQAEELIGLLLFIQKEKLPALLDEDEFYFHNLIGLQALSKDGNSLGSVIDVQDFGAGALLAVGSKEKSEYIPFRKDYVVSLDLNEKKIVLNPPQFFETGKEVK